MHLPLEPEHQSLVARTVVTELLKRVHIPINVTSSAGQIAAGRVDPWSQAGQYGLGWVYFGLIILLCTTAIRWYHYWGDKMRTAIFKDEVIMSAKTLSPLSPHELPSAVSAMSTASTRSGMTDGPARHFFPLHGSLPGEYSTPGITLFNFIPVNVTIALCRWIFYRPIPELTLLRLRFIFPSVGMTAIVMAGLIFCLLYCFVPQPYYYQSMSFGSPPLAIRAGMLSVALIPWIVALASKANFISVMTGIAHNRLNVLHRWGAYLCLLLALIHAIPFWLQSARDRGGFETWRLYFSHNVYIFGTGIAALVPLGLLCFHSLSILRIRAYEVFVIIHAPLAWVFIAMLFWHCHNFLTSWNYLFATAGLIGASYLYRLFNCNWANPFRSSWLVGEEAAISLLPENAVKITIPSQKRWKPGQHVYLRIPAIAKFQSHPFTIASLCSDDFPSSYNEKYRDMTLVFRPFGGFTRKVYNTAIERGRYKTYRAFVEGPYGGMQREMASFNQVIFFAGGSGITAVASQLLDLTKRIREGKAVTTSVKVIWALKRPETIEWFREELRICREYAPPNTIHCEFYITALERNEAAELSPCRRHRGSFFKESVKDISNKPFQEIVKGCELGKCPSDAWPACIPDTPTRQERQDEISALPKIFIKPQIHSSNGRTSNQRSRFSLALQIPPQAKVAFDFGFPQQPSLFQKSLMRFAHLPSSRRDDWWTDYGRPDIPQMLSKLSKDFGRRTCIYVCGPPSMRLDVANTVARLQSDIWTKVNRDEIFLHAENYAL